MYCKVRTDGDRFHVNGQVIGPGFGESFKQAFRLLQSSDAHPAQFGDFATGFDDDRAHGQIGSQMTSITSI